MSPSFCPDCGKPLPTGAPAGPCAACLLKLGEQSNAVDDRSTALDEVKLTESAGAVIGRYKLLEKLGEGGFGSVWAAEQREPVKRRVALKIIKLGMDTKQVVARFEAERQALAMMDHPNIAKVLDAGTTDTGRPFFVMELVKGISITKYCSQEGLDTKARLDLFIKVCQAIQHAHQKGIIHRDVKPSNIMVTLHDGVPVPKVIDFGIAKATQHELTELTIYTQHHQFIGTPAYMSPEQAEMSGLDIDTRSDIYSLGVLLYELLTGTTPFDTAELMASGLDEMRKIIREREPIRPSTRLSQSQAAPASRDTPTHRIGSGKSAIDRDLDWIVMKCLEKDRTRRYETANGLSMDLKRHLNHEPIIARPPSNGYRLRKAWLRNKVAYSAVAIVATALIAGGTISSWQTAVAQKARRAEERQRLAAEESSRQAISNARTAEMQKNIAEENARTAQAAIDLAEEREVELLRRAYAADLNLAHQAVKNNNLGRAIELLNRYRPGAGATDLRGWEWRYLWSLCRSDAAFELCRFLESDPVLSTAISPDGKWVALGGYERTGVRVWDIASRREIAQLAVGKSFCQVAFSPDGRWLAWGSRTELTLWDCTSREMVAQARADAPVVSIGFSGDGQRIVTFTESDAITIWDADGLRKLKKLPVPHGHAWLGSPFAFSPDLKVAVRVEGWDSIVAVDLESGEERWRIKSDQGSCQAMAISPDGQWLASGFGLTDGNVYLFEMATGREVAVLPGHRAWISSLIFWPDGTKLASASADQTIRIWDLESRAMLRILKGHKLEVWSMALSPQTDTLVSGGKDGSVLVWDPRADKKERNHFQLPGDHAAWAFSTDGKGIVTVERDSFRVIHWSGENDAKAQVLPAMGLEEAGMTREWSFHLSSFLFSPSGSRLAALSTNGMLHVWDVNEGTRIVEFPTGMNLAGLLSFSGDESKIWLNRRTGSSALVREFDFVEWDVARRQLLRTIPDVSWPFAIAPDQWLFSNSATGSFQNLETGQSYTPSMFKGRFSTLHGSPAFSQDGEHLVVSHDAGLLTVWKSKDLISIAEPQPIRTLGGILMSFFSTSFSPDGSRLFGASHGTEAIKIWETATFHELLTLGAKAQSFMQPRMSPDGLNLVASASGKIFVWRAASWEEIKRTEAQEKVADKKP